MNLPTEPANPSPYAGEFFLWTGIILGVFLLAIFIGAYFDRRNKRNSEVKTLGYNRQLITKTVANIQSVLEIHPELSGSIKIKGDNTRKPTDFGRIYGENIDFTFPIDTPMTELSDEYGSTTVPATTAYLTIAGTLDSYRIAVKHSLGNLVYTSQSAEITEDN